MPDSDPKYFYFFGTEDGLEVKIGSSDDPRRRKTELERDGGYGIKLIDLFFMRGWTNGREEDLKYALNSYRSRPASTEHYKATSPEMRAWLRFLWQQPFTGNSIEPNNIQELQVCDLNTSWFPFQPGHSVPIATTPLGFSVEPTEGHLAGTRWSDLLTDAVMEGDFYLPKAEADLIWEMWPYGPDLDVASCKAANQVIRARKFYGAHQMGETKPWEPRSYANPPFDRWPVFYDRMQQEIKSGRTWEVLAVFPMDKLGTAVGQRFLRSANGACFRKGEVRFEGPLISKRTQISHLGHSYKKKTLTLDGGKFQTSGRLRVVYFYFGDELQKFKNVFGRVGSIMIPESIQQLAPIEAVDISEFEEQESESEPESDIIPFVEQVALFG